VRIGVAYPGGADEPTAWSGIPAGLLRGLREAGLEGVSLDSSPGEAVERAARLLLAPLYPPTTPRHPRLGLLLASMGPEIAHLRSRTLERRLRAAGPLDALVIPGGLAQPDTDVPLVPYVDMTPPLADRCGYPLWRALPDRALRARTRQQAELHGRAVVCCTLTRFAAEAVERDYRIVRDKVHAIGLGRNHEPVSAERDWSRPRFLFVGREWDRKRGAAAVEGFRHVRKRCPEAILDVVSHHPPLNEEGVLEHGPCDPAEVSALFARATCFVMPSAVEPAGIAYVEAGAAGTPSIGTTVGGAAELIGPGGRVVDPYDQEAITAAMVELSDPEVAQRLGVQARAHSERFTWRATAERLRQVLERTRP
jgi:glycosyltransferase involved in cell wall biosynthesis